MLRIGFARRFGCQRSPNGCVSHLFSQGGASMRMGKLLAGVCVAALALSGATAWSAEVTPDRLVNAGTDAEAGNWLMVGKSYNSNRFSTLNDINAGNVADLHLVMAAPIGGTEPTGFGIGGVQT